MSNFKRGLMMAGGKKDFTNYNLVFPSISTTEPEEYMYLNIYVNNQDIGDISPKNSLTVNVKKGDVIKFVNLTRQTEGEQYIKINGNKINVDFNTQYVDFTLTIDDIYTIDEIYIESFGIYFP